MCPKVGPFLFSNISVDLIKDITSPSKLFLENVYGSSYIPVTVCFNHFKNVVLDTITPSLFENSLLFFNIFKM